MFPKLLGILEQYLAPLKLFYISILLPNTKYYLISLYANTVFVYYALFLTFPVKHEL